MKRLLTYAVGLLLLGGISVGIAQNINRGIQISQDPTGPIGFDNRNGSYWPGNLYTTNNRTAPTLGTCGTSPSITGTDTAGRVTEGTGSPTSCQWSFAQAYPTTPYCFAQGSSSSTPIGITATPNGISLAHSAATSMVVNYFCFGQQP